MFELETPRLTLIPLDPQMLALELEDDRAMEEALGLEVGHSELRGELRDAVADMLQCARDYPEQWLWCTDWKIVLRREKRVIGGLCFKGPPTQAGEVEVGYGLHAGNEHQGYMTEALLAALDWALAQPGVTAVLAETEKSNEPSQRVLQSLGFHRCRETEQFWWWCADIASLREPSLAAAATATDAGSRRRVWAGAGRPRPDPRGR